jgi:hypothetical protein
MDLNDDWRNAKPGMLKSVDELLEQREWVKYDKEQHSEEVHRRREKRQQEWADMDVVEYYEANLAKGAK